MRGALLSLVLCFASCKAAPSEPLRVAAAADLAHTFSELGPAFEAQAPADLKLTLGSTGLLARQIIQGAPFDLFLAANVGYVEQVVKAGACDGNTQKTYARGRLVIWTKGAGGAELTPASLGDARFILSAVAAGAQGLVAAAILLVVTIHVLQRRRQIGALRAFGAPRGVVFAIVWLESFVIVGIGVIAGFGLGYLAVRLGSAMLAKEAGFALPVELRAGDLAAVAVLLAVTAAASLVPALLAYRQSPASALRA